MSGKLVISLDFELQWGIIDHQRSEMYGKNIQGVWEVFPRLLKLFENYQVNVTFATVGFLFASTKNQILSYLPKKIPHYSNKKLSPYEGYFDKIGNRESEDKFHYAESLIELIRKYPGHEIATHTFSHFYCLEDGQTLLEFIEDIRSAVKIAEHKGITLNSIVFPRNQMNIEYLEALHKMNISTYRGNQKSWLYNKTRNKQKRILQRALRLIDAYVNISGNHCFNVHPSNPDFPINVPASRFLRPYSPYLKILEPLRMRRIKKSMSYAAKRNRVFHLWWHPHNFGINQSENLKILEKILMHYKMLQQKFGFESVTMNYFAKKSEHLG